MKVTIVPYGIVPKVAIRAYIDAGALYDRADQVWMSKLKAKLLKEGTATRTSAQLADDVADMGGELEIDAGSELHVRRRRGAFRFGSAVRGVACGRAAESGVACLGNGPAEGRPGSRARSGQIHATVAGRGAFHAGALPGHAYGRVYPSEAALAGYTIDQVNGFYQANFSAARTHLYIAGKLDPGLRDAVRGSFSDWKKGTPPAEKPPAGVKARSLQLIDRPGSAQSTLYIGLPVLGPGSPDYVREDVMNTLLGGSFASRITSNIREQKGYTYSPFSNIGTKCGVAYWVEQADVTTAVTGPSLKEIFYEIDRLRREAPKPPELQGIQTYLSGLFVLKNTVSPNAVIGQLHFVDSQDLDRSFLTTYVQRVNQVTPEDIQRLAETQLVPSKMTIVVVGDLAKISDQLKPYQAPAE